MIIVLGSIVATAITTLVMMVTMKGGTDFDPQVQEGNKSISSSFDRLAAGGGDIMVYSLLATIGASLMSLGLLANNRCKINLIQESLTNSRIEHEENKSITSSFLPTEQKAHEFENGEHKIIIFVTCGILLLLVTIGFCLFSWGCCGFGGCRKYIGTI